MRFFRTMAFIGIFLCMTSCTTTAPVVVPNEGMNYIATAEATFSPAQTAAPTPTPAIPTPHVTEEPMLLLEPPERIVSREEFLEEGGIFHVDQRANAQLDGIIYENDETVSLRFHMRYKEDMKYTRHLMEVLYADGTVLQYELLWPGNNDSYNHINVRLYDFNSDGTEELMIHLIGWGSRDDYSHSHIFGISNQKITPLLIARGKYSGGTAGKRYDEMDHQSATFLTWTETDVGYDILDIKGEKVLRLYSELYMEGHYDYQEDFRDFVWDPEKEKFQFTTEYGASVNGYFYIF